MARLLQNIDVTVEEAGEMLAVHLTSKEPIDFKVIVGSTDSKIEALERVAETIKLAILADSGYYGLLLKEAENDAKDNS